MCCPRSGASASTFTILPAQSEKLAIDVNRDLVPVALIGSEGMVLAVSPTLGVAYENPKWINASANARFVGAQFEDDQNTLRLGSYWVFDLFLSRPIGKWLELYAGVENLFNQTYSVGRTSDGVVSIGAPLLVHGGARISLR